MIDPLHQFEIRSLIPIEFMGADLSFTNSSLFMVITLLCIAGFLSAAVARKTLVPGRIGAAAEMLYEVTEQMLESTAGEKARKFLPLIFSLFIFLIVSNLLGMIPYSFTVTSHIAITFALAITIFIGVTVIGFIKHGFHYLSFFLPEGTPIVMAPLIVFIEFFAYLARPISLSIRLAANMTAGHIVLKVLASFVIMAGFFGVLPLALLTLLVGFEIFVAVLQAYIFTILTCVYLGDALNLH